MKATIRSVGVAIALCGLSSFTVSAQDISLQAQAQIAAIISAKQNFTPAQAKVDSNLIFGAMAARNDASVASFSSLFSAGTDAAPVVVDIRGNVTPALLSAIVAAGGTVLTQSAQWGMVHASLPLSSVETVAASPDVKSIRSAARKRVSGPSPSFRKAPRARATASSILSRSGLDLIGALTSQGYISQAANVVINSMGFNGAGVKVGVLSDSASAARVAALIATGDLPAGASVLPGQNGSAIADGGTDEGTAMMEIVHDMAPGADIIFATAFTDEISFANNIIALQQAGCKVIVDDVSYFDEGVFQDGPIAQAVNQVTAAGSIYFSSAANSGNLTWGTSGTWEGDFQGNGPITGVIAGLGETGTVHNFRTVSSPQNYDVLTAATAYIQIMWSDPLGGSANDYDLFVLNSTGNTVKAASVTRQTGSQDPYELVYLNNGNTNFAVNDRIVIVKFSGTDRAIHLDTLGARLSIGTTGSTFGHNAGLNTISTAATYWNSAKTGTKAFTGAANPIEVFSSDGPRKIFYTPDGTPITANNFLFATNGGTTLQKPDLTATDGNSAKTPGFNPFYGTSAAAPHAAGVAALMLQARPDYTPAQIKTAMINGTVDNMAPGTDRDSGYGIVMATLALQYALAH